MEDVVDGVDGADEGQEICAPWSKDVSVGWGLRNGYGYVSCHAWWVMGISERDA